MTNQISLTIIIPHYNSVKELNGLLESIYGESKDIEVIVIDDRSDIDLDDFDTCRIKYSAKGTIFLDNDTGKKGAGTCRNIGLKRATGEWVLFADADDYFLKGFYTTVKKYFDSKYDIVFFIPTSINLDSKEEGNRHIIFEKYIEEYIERKGEAELLKLKYKLVSPCSKLINRRIIVENKLEFEEISVANDRMFSIQSSYFAKNIMVDTEKIYCITRKSGSLTTKQDENTYFIRLYAFIRSYVFLQEKLKKEEFEMLDLYAISRVGQAIINRYSIRTIFESLRILKKYKVRLIGKDMKNPIYICECILNFLQNFKGEKKYYAK